MSARDFSRQRGILDPANIVHPVHVIGCGGIGSATVLGLACMGFTKFHLWDGDRVEEPNIPTQLLWHDGCIGVNKARVLGAILRRKLEGDGEVVAHECMFDPTLHSHLLDGIVVVGVDSMEAVQGRPCGRKELWERAIRFNPKVVLLLDGRLGGEHLELFTVRPWHDSDVAAYENENVLFSQQRMSQAPCAQGAIIYVAQIIGGLIARQIARFCNDERAPLRVGLNLSSLEFFLEEPNQEGDAS